MTDTNWTERLRELRRAAREAEGTADPRRPGTLNACAAVGANVGGGTQGGASWNNKTVCPVCGKTVMLTSGGRLRSHGTRRK